MKTPETDQEWIEVLWSLDGISFVDAAKRMGCRYQNLSYRARKYGFRKQGGRGMTAWSSGPCVSCGVPTDASHTDDAGRCGGCVALEAVNQDARRALRESHGVDLEWERRKHRERMEEREEGIRDRLPRRVVFHWPGGDAMGARMPGAA